MRLTTKGWFLKVHFFLRHPVQIHPWIYNFNCFRNPSTLNKLVKSIERRYTSLGAPGDVSGLIPPFYTEIFFSRRQCNGDKIVALSWISIQCFLSRYRLFAIVFFWIVSPRPDPFQSRAHNSKETYRKKSIARQKALNGNPALPSRGENCSSIMPHDSSAKFPPVVAESSKHSTFGNDCCEAW